MQMNPKAYFSLWEKQSHIWKNIDFVWEKKIGVYPPVEKAIKFAVDYLKS